MSERCRSGLPPGLGTMRLLTRILLRTSLLVIGFMATFAVAAEPEPALAPPVDTSAVTLKRHVGFLASDTLEGRQAGTRGGHAAAAYLVSELKRIGLQPAGTVPNDFRQHFGRNYANVLAKLPGSDPQLSQEVVLIGAHYDHVGYGNSSNSFGPYGQIHNGADDNASGVAILLLLAERLAQAAPSRTIIWAFWDAEEAGLLGSRHWVRSPTIDRERLKMAINLDMVGRLRDDTVNVMGWRTAAGLRSRLVEANRVNLQFRFEPNVTDDSDHHAFYSVRIPVLHFDTGKHDDYHRPSDDAEKLNYAGMQRIAGLVEQLVIAVANDDALPPFRQECWNERVAAWPKAIKSAPTPRLGVDWNSEPVEQGGFEILSVTAGFPAHKAGLKPGDQLLEIDGRPLKTFEDLRTAITTAAADCSLTWFRPTTGDRQQAEVQLPGTPVSHGLTLRFDSALPGCAIVESLIETAWADRAGLWPGDVLLEVAGAPVSSSTVLETAWSQSTEPISLRAERRGRPFQVKLSGQRQQLAP